MYITLFCRKTLHWMNGHGLVLVREVLLFKPWCYRQGYVGRGKFWRSISEVLNAMEQTLFKSGERSTIDRLCLLIKNELMARNMLSLDYFSHVKRRSTSQNMLTYCSWICNKLIAVFLMIYWLLNWKHTTLIKLVYIC